MIHVYYILVLLLQNSRSLNSHIYSSLSSSAMNTHSSPVSISSDKKPACLFIPYQWPSPLTNTSSAKKHTSNGSIHSPLTHKDELVNGSNSVPMSPSLNQVSLFEPVLVDLQRCNQRSFLKSVRKLLEKYMSCIQGMENPRPATKEKKRGKEKEKEKAKEKAKAKTKKDVGALPSDRLQLDGDEFFRSPLRGGGDGCLSEMKERERDEMVKAAINYCKSSNV